MPPTREEGRGRQGGCAGERDLGTVETRSAEAGRRALLSAVENLTGLSVDHYAEITLAGFHALTTTIGGVDVCLKAAVDEPLSGARFAAGPQTISGAEALAFVRQRHGLPRAICHGSAAAGVPGRRRRKDHVRAHPHRPHQARRLVDALQSSLVIDAGWDLLAFARQASDIAAGNLRFVTIPTLGPETNDSGDVMRVDPRNVQDFVETTVAEQEEAAQAAVDAPKPVPPLTGVIAERYVVDGATPPRRSGGLRRAAHVRDLGFVRGTVDKLDARRGVGGPLHRRRRRRRGGPGRAARGISVEAGSEITPGT